MKVDYIDDDFINNSIPPIELFENFSDDPTGIIFYSEKNENINDNIDLVELDDIDLENIECDETIPFKDHCYQISISNKIDWHLTISNQEFWFNLHPNESICIISNDYINIENYSDLIKNKEIIDFFISILDDELKRIESLSLYYSFIALIDLHEVFYSNYDKIWSTEVLNVVNSILKKINSKIELLNKDSNYRNIINMIILDQNDSLEKHFIRIEKLVALMTDFDFDLLIKSYLELTNKKYNIESIEIPFIQIQYNKKFTIVTKIKLFYFKKLLNHFRNKNFKNKLVKPQTTIIFSAIPFDKKKFTKELHDLFIITKKQSNLEETAYLTKIISNEINITSFNKKIVEEFDNWLKIETNLFLFKTFLSFSSSKTFNLIPSGSYKKLSESIASKFKHPGLGSYHLNKYFINSNEPNLSFINLNKSNIILIQNYYLQAKNKLQNGLVKKMIFKIFEIYKSL